MLPNLKFVRKITPIIRKRDGAEINYRFQLGLTLEEALLISNMFLASRASNSDYPTVSLFRNALCLIAEGNVDEGTLIDEMTKWELRRKLASKLSKPDYDRCLAYLESLQKQPVKHQPDTEKSTLPSDKITPPLGPVLPKKERREYVHEPSRR